MIFEGTYFTPTNINYYYYLSSNNKNKNTIVSLRTMINLYVNVKCYDSNDIVLSSLWKFSQNKFILLSPLHVTTEEKKQTKGSN